MKSLIFCIICFCALLLTIDSGEIKMSQLIETLDSMQSENKSIDGIFEPSEDGFIGSYIHCLLYKGIFIPTTTEVAMKFTEEHLGRHEYEMYTYLDAINNGSVEAYGIPSIYYYGTWKGHAIMAMTLFERQFHRNLKNDRGKLTEIDLLVIFREIVRITKYIHRRGVFHKKLNLISIMFRGHQGFIYDFSVADRVTDGIADNKLMDAVVDWQDFFVEMFYFFSYPKKRWRLLGLDKQNPDHAVRMRSSKNFADSLIEDFDPNDPDKFKGLRKVFIEFVKCTHGQNDTPPSYDHLHQVIVEELEKKKPAFPSWLSNENEENDATSITNTIAPISNIANPFACDEPQYAEVNYNYFNEIYPQLNQGQPSSSGSADQPSSSRSANQPSSSGGSSPTPPTARSRKKLWKLCFQG